MTVTCPECQAIYRIDPARVPDGGTRARCSACGAVLAIGLPSTPAPWLADAGPVDPSIVAASDAAAAPEVWDWFPVAEGSANRGPDGIGSVGADDDPWADVWGEARGDALPEVHRGARREASGSARPGERSGVERFQGTGPGIHAAGPARAGGARATAEAAPTDLAADTDAGAGSSHRRVLPHPPAVSPRRDGDGPRG